MHDLGIRSDEYVTITDSDFERLLPILDHHGGQVSEPLETELQRAVIVAQREISPDVVTMNSEVVYEDVASGARRTIRVVYPQDADVAAGRVSVLAPIGAALLGLRVGQEITWRVVNGAKRIRVVAIPYQPEAAGDFAL